MPQPLDYRDYRAPTAGRPDRALATLGVVAILLSIASFIVVLLGASQEPYYGPFDPIDAIVQVGIGGALVAMWAVWSAWILLLVYRRRLPTVTISALLWAVICSFYLTHGVSGYLQDRRAWAAGLPNAPPPPPWALQMMQAAKRPATTATSPTTTAGSR